jgi:predicted ATP-dependent serine protease
MATRSKAASAPKGRPPKSEGGLNEVLFVRTSRTLLDELDALVREEKQERPYRVVTRADIARELLHEAIARKKDGPK